MSVSGIKTLLNVLNGCIAFIGLGLAVTAIWFYVEVYTFTSLRNSNHYLLDYNVYWPQAIPWLFFLVGVFILCVTFCGFAGVRKNKRATLTTYVICCSIVAGLLVLVAVIALVFADNQATDNFIKDTIWDVYFQSKSDNEVADSFGRVERRLHCCGVDSPRDYKNWKTEFPQSCCDVFYRGWLDPYVLDCDFTNKLANERHGCSQVASQYARIVIKSLAAICVFVGMLSVTSAVVAVCLSKAMLKKRRVLASLASKSEAESERVLI